MKSASSSVKYAQRGDFLYCLKKSALLILGIFSPIMFVLIYGIGIRKPNDAQYEIMWFSYLFALTGFAAGIQATDFLTSKKKGNLWLSLGITKRKLLINRINAALLCLLFSFALSFALPLFLQLKGPYGDTIFGISTAYSNYTPFHIYFIITAGSAILTLINFSLTVFFCVRTYSPKTSIILTVIVQFLPVLLVYFISVLFENGINGSVVLFDAFDSNTFDSAAEKVEEFILSYMPLNLPMYYEISDNISMFFFTGSLCLIISLCALILV